ncbi:cysteine hydrolase family protein [Bacillus sp. Marseille-P3661]|uniref:cysteine hydrolase family protein n=1 Tax=Bacillus sp. Marseille-P3661 TaxID=1936234 RepID=UPI000C83F1D6|nr:isochorismatase family cysteine hydrolase [Bacillus sp. Marseille-P3661]
MEMKALINIDYTNDFVAENGVLHCGEPGRAIEERVVVITEEFAKRGDFVIFAIDTHYKGDPYHPETKLFPPHNIAETDGINLFGKLDKFYQNNKEQENIYYMPKTRYSAFAGTDLEVKLRERGITEVHLVGVATDICVLHTAVDAYNKGFKIVIYKDAVASFNSAGHEWALGHFQTALGAEIK